VTLPLVLLLWLLLQLILPLLQLWPLVLLALCWNSLCLPRCCSCKVLQLKYQMAAAVIKIPAVAAPAGFRCCCFSSTAATASGRLGLLPSTLAIMTL